MDRRKLELQKWNNDVGERIEDKLKVNHKKLACVTEVVQYVCGMGEYSMQLTNSRSPCYKAPTQRTIYKNSVRPMETHDLANDWESSGGHELDEDYNRHIIPPQNPQLPGRPEKRRRESQRQGKKVRRCSKCGDVGYYRNTYRNPCADFDVGHAGDVVPAEELFSAYGQRRHPGMSLSMKQDNGVCIPLHC
ncbi:hypothetical protein Cgig2_009340 [Carnegiea gigantea]|uniref:Uncharacterized protein n=1 Tax=Carnegiea gigantea TaxID=171969 RepID=A0A9Q1GLU0_9CARY|nr:hypothetical protein Cgig2_009340 [Carnegiea gigantea]